jgi:hypothetical protein
MYACYFINIAGRTGLAQSVCGRLTEWMAGVRFPVVARYFYLHHSVPTASVALLASYRMGTGGYFLRVKEAGA